LAFLSYIHIIKDRKMIFTQFVILSLKIWFRLYML